MGDKKKEPHFVIAITKVLPEEVIDDDALYALRDKIAEKIKEFNTVIETSKLEPIAFGLKALIIRLKIPEETVGGTQPIEDAIESIEGVQRVEVMMVSRM
ncbi:MAG: elongation factor 1-beta [Promethearchaeota archaeon]